MTLAKPRQQVLFPYVPNGEIDGHQAVVKITPVSSLFCWGWGVIELCPLSGVKWQEPHGS